MGHTQLSKLVNSEKVIGLEKLKGFDFKPTEDDKSRGICNSCEQGKSCRKPIGSIKSHDLSTSILNRLHDDLKGPIEVSTLNGNRYVLTITDEFSRKVWIVLLQYKSDATKHIINIINFNSWPHLSTVLQYMVDYAATIQYTQNTV